MRGKQNRSKHRRKYWEAHDRESYTCPECGRKECHEEVFRLEVHHKDGDLYNGDLENLVALCRRCHIKEEDGVLNDLIYWKQEFNRLLTEPVQDEDLETVMEWSIIHEGVGEDG